MKIGLMISISFLMFGNLFAQNTQKEKIEKAKDKIILHFNAQQPDSLYAMAGAAFKKQLSTETFKTVYENNLSPLGTFKAAEFETLDKGVAKYKATFDAAILSMFISMDSTDKLSVFLFQPYKKPVTGPITKVATDNVLATGLDKKVEDVIQLFMFESKSVGLSIGILKDGKEYFYNYGETTKGNKQLPVNKSLYEIGSVTKTFTGILLAKAVTEGKIKLTDPVNKYLPADAAWLIAGGDTAKIVHLSNHTSGLPPLPDNFDMTNEVNPYKDYDEAKLLAYLKTAKLQYKPGVKHSYCNLGVGLLGYILSKTYKMSFDEMVTKFIAAKAGMTDTREFLLKKDSALFMQGYNDALEKQSQWDFKVLSAAGSLRSNTADMLKYALLNLETTDADLKKAIDLSHQPTFKDAQQQIGLNWFLQNWGWGNMLFHGGATGGYRSFFAINPVTKNAVVILCNSFTNIDAAGVALLNFLDKKL
jgi:CubicO group peptidase (beta-lactamase class C family)